MEKNKSTLFNKIFMAIAGTLIVGLLGWGTWVTAGIYNIDNIQACAADNQTEIKEKANSLQTQINTRMDKQDKKLDSLKNDLNKRMDKQDSKFERQDIKLNNIMLMLIDIKKEK